MAEFAGIRIEEHRRDPIGFHSNELDRVLTHIRLSRFTQENKGVIVCTKPFEEWCLGRLSGVRGIPPSIDRSQPFSSRDAAEHAVFLRRLKELGLIED